MVAGDEVFAVRVESGIVEFVRAEGVAFLGDETFVVSVVGFVGAANDVSGSDVTAYETSSVATGIRRIRIGIGTGQL